MTAQICGLPHPIFLIFGRFACSTGIFNKLPYIAICFFQVFPSQIHHMPASITVETKPIFHSSTGINLPHGVFGVKIGGGTIVVPRLEHHL